MKCGEYRVRGEKRVTKNFGERRPERRDLKVDRGEGVQSVW